MYTPITDDTYVAKLLKSNTLVSYINYYSLFKNQFFSKIPIKCIRNSINNLNKIRTELKVVNHLEKLDIERIMYDFAETMHAYGIESNDLSKLRKLNNDITDEYGITFNVFTDNRKWNVTGINMKIWTKDKLAKLNLKLVVEVGNLNLNITWAYKNEDGIYVNYNRTEDILIARDEIKSLLIEYVTKQVIYLMNIS